MPHRHQSACQAGLNSVTEEPSILVSGPRPKPQLVQRFDRRTSRTGVSSPILATALPVFARRQICIAEFCFLTHTGVPRRLLSPPRTKNGLHSASVLRIAFQASLSLTSCFGLRLGRLHPCRRARSDIVAHVADRYETGLSVCDSVVVLIP